MAELQQTVDAFCSAWNRHDVDALATLWDEDGDLNHPWGFHAVGRDAVRALLEREHAGAMAESTLAVLRIHAHGDERTHFAELHGILSGVRAPNGRAYDLPHTMAVMFVRAEAEWRIRSLTPVANPRS